MNSGEQRSNPFIPLTTAVSDTLLQMRAKPHVFLTVWFFIALLPQLPLAFVLQQSITEMTETSYQVSGEMPDSGVMRNSIRGQSALSMLLILPILAIQIYQYSVLADVIARFRKKLPPEIARSFIGGFKGYVSLLKVILAGAGRILIEPVVIAILGTVIATLLEQEILINAVLIVTFFMLAINLLRYGLAPFIHLSLEAGWRSALAISKSYYRTHRLRVLILFGFVIFLPSVILGLLSLVPLTRAMSIVSGALQSIVGVFMSGVLINFGMNNFIPESLK